MQPFLQPFLSSAWGYMYLLFFEYFCENHTEDLLGMDKRTKYSNLGSYYKWHDWSWERGRAGTILPAHVNPPHKTRVGQ